MAGRLSMATALEHRRSIMNRRRSRTYPIPHLFMIASVAVLAITAMATEASAEVVEGSCTGTVTMNGELAIDADRAAMTPAVIAESGTAQIVGSFDREPSDEAMPYRSELQGRHAFGTWTISSWSGQTLTPEVDATESYTLPVFIPRGSGAVPLSLDVAFGDDTCQIVGTVAVAGPTFDGLTIGLLIATLLLLAATIAAGRAGSRGRGRPLVGLFVGLLAGLAGATTLFGAGAIALDSILWWIAPLVLGALGIALGVAAPFGRDTRGRELMTPGTSDPGEADISSTDRT